MHTVLLTYTYMDICGHVPSCASCQLFLIHMVGGWMGRVSMCNETLLDECYLCLLAQVSFILEFSGDSTGDSCFCWTCHGKLSNGKTQDTGLLSDAAIPFTKTLFGPRKHFLRSGSRQGIPGRATWGWGWSWRLQRCRVVGITICFMYVVLLFGVHFTSQLLGGVPQLGPGYSIAMICSWSLT